MTYLTDERADGIYAALLERLGAEVLLAELIGIMSDDLYRAYMDTLWENEGGGEASE